MENQNKKDEYVAGKLFSVMPLKTAVLDADGKMYFENLPLTDGLAIEVKETNYSYVVETLEWEDDEVQLKSVGFRFQQLMTEVTRKYDASHVRALLEEYLNCVDFAKHAIEDAHTL